MRTGNSVSQVRRTSGVHRTSPETQFNRGAWLTLLASGLFILLNVAQVVYRFTIPGLGWAELDPDSFEPSQIRLEMNAVGAPSLLQPGDIVQKVAGIPAAQLLDNVLAPPEGWRVGGKAQVSVVRAGQLLEFEVPLVHWTLRAWWLANFANFTSLWNWLVTFLLFGVGVFTFFNRPGNLAARFLFVFGLASLSISLGDSVKDYLALAFNFPAAFAKVFFANIIFAYLLGPSFLNFTLTFPRPKGFIQRRAVWLLAPYLVGSMTILLLIVAPPLAVIGFALTFVMLLLGVAALIHAAFAMRDAISRAQLRWAVGGVASGVALFLLNIASFSRFREVFIALASLGYPVISISLAIAILRYHLFDIDLIIRRTLVYTILTAMLALVYFGLVIFLEGMLRTLVGDGGQIATVISTLAIAALFTPLRRRVQQVIDRRFYRRKYNAEHALAEFAATARGETDLEALSAQMVAIVQQTMQPDRLSLWLRDE